MAETLTKTGVIGSPINHSLSPNIHNYWIKKNKIKTAEYQKIKIDALELNHFDNSNYLFLLLLKSLFVGVCKLDHKYKGFFLPL